MKPIKSLIYFCCAVYVSSFGGRGYSTVSVPLREPIVAELDISLESGYFEFRVLGTWNRPDDGRSDPCKLDDRAFLAPHLHITFAFAAYIIPGISDDIAEQANFETNFASNVDSFCMDRQRKILSYMKAPKQYFYILNPSDDASEIEKGICEKASKSLRAQSIYTEPLRSLFPEFHRPSQAEKELEASKFDEQELLHISKNLVDLSAHIGPSNLYDKLLQSGDPMVTRYEQDLALFTEEFKPPDFADPKEVIIFILEPGRSSERAIFSLYGCVDTFKSDHDFEFKPAGYFNQVIAKFCDQVINPELLPVPDDRAATPEPNNPAPIPEISATPPANDCNLLRKIVYIMFWPFAKVLQFISWCLRSTGNLILGFCS